MIKFFKNSEPSTKDESITDFNIGLDFISNLQNYMSKLQKQVNLYLELDKVFIKSCFSTSTNSHKDILVL